MRLWVCVGLCLGLALPGLCETTSPRSGRAKLVPKTARHQVAAAVKPAAARPKTPATTATPVAPPPEPDGTGFRMTLSPLTDLSDDASVPVPVPQRPSVALPLQRRLPQWASPLQAHSPQAAQRWVVLPVLLNEGRKAYGDVARVVANQVAAGLSRQWPDAPVIYPGEAVSTLRAQGLGSAYDQWVNTYLANGRPDPRLSQWVSQKLLPDASRLVLVGATMNPNEMTRPGHWWQWVQARSADLLPRGGNYTLESWVTVYDLAHATGNNPLPLLWQRRFESTFHTAKAGPVSLSVYDDAEALVALSQLAEGVSRQMLGTMPLAVLEPDVATRVQAERVPLPPESPSKAP